MSWVFPSENQTPYFDAIEDFYGQQDAAAYAAREDRHIIIRGGGTISFLTAGGTLSWTDDFEMLAAITGFQWRVAPSSIQLLEGEIAYLDLPRAPSDNIYLELQKGNQIPSTDTAHILCVRIDDRIYFFNGASVAEGSPLTDIGAGGGGGGSALEILDEGVSQTANATSIDFVGPGVVASAVGSAVTVTVAGGGAATLQGAYDGGEVIALSDARGPVEINDSLQTVASAGLAITKNTTDGAALELTNQQAGAANRSLEANGKVAISAPINAGEWGITVSPGVAETEGGVDLYRLIEVDDTGINAIGGSPTFIACDADPNGNVTSGDPGSIALVSDGRVFKKTANPSTWVELGSTAQVMHFTANGPLASLSLSPAYTDGLKEVGQISRVQAIYLTQEVDGTAGATTVELYKVSSGGVETQITSGGSLSLAFGGGANQRILSTSFIGTNNDLAADDRLGIKFSAVQGGLSAAEVTVSVLLTGPDLATAPGLPEDTEVTHAINKSVTGTVHEVVGTVYLETGTIVAADSRVFMGVDNVSDVAELEIRDAITTALIDTITATGLLQDAQPGGDFAVPSDAWYNLRLRADTPGVTATILGVKFVYSLGQGTRIRQAIEGEVTGTVFQNVGAVYLPAGTLQTPARLFMGATTVGPDAAEVELRRETGGTLIATWNATGLLQEATQGSAVVIPAADWYNIRLRGNGGGVTARLQGIDWTVLV